MSRVSRAATSTTYKAAYSVLYEAELERCAAKCRLQDEKKRAERALRSLTESKACDLGPFHQAQASVEWWDRVVATAARILEERQRHGRMRT